MSTRATVALIALLLISAASALAQQPGATDIHRLSLPGKAWALDVDLNGFTTSPAELMTDLPANMRFAATIRLISQPKPKAGPDDDAYTLTALSKPEGRVDHLAMLTIRLEPAQMKGDATTLRADIIDRQIKSRRASKSDIKTLEYKQIPIVSYKIPAVISIDGFAEFSMQGPPMRGLVAYLVQDDTWIIINYVGQPLKEGDEKQFYALLDSIKITDTTHPANSFDYAHLGRTAYQLKDYPKAVEAFSKALVLEHQQRQLSTAQWRALVEDTADALGAMGDRARAQAVLEYGVGSEPTYPYFHLGLARLHASLHDLDQTIASLQKAYENGQNGHKFIGGPLPDPMHDPAFAAFQKDPRFRDAVKQMKKLLKD
ncbi:MAG TPA: hypothetical protein VF525_04125 [Pyrinomonadaceae bacterium]|jgi:tetratricopeptide (TPR) repeat protein